GFVSNSGTSTSVSRVPATEHSRGSRHLRCRQRADGSPWRSRLFVAEGVRRSGLPSLDEIAALSAVHGKSMSLAAAVVALLGISLASTLAVGRVRAFALRQLMLDIPNERSLHTVPIPRGGGIVISVAIIAVGALGLIAGMLPRNIALALMGAVGAI